MRANGRPAVAMPAFLSRGYHVRVDLPPHVEGSGHPDVTVAAALGPGTHIAPLVGDQVMKSGWRDVDSFVLAAAGPSDPRALSDLHTPATAVSALTGSRV